MTTEDAQGSVRPWSPPNKPQVPDFELNSSAADLNAYKEQEVETVVEENAEAANVEQGDWLVLDEAEQQEENHHGH